jgi:hypothetical protein
MRLRQRVSDERSNTRRWLEKLLAAEELVIGVLHPTLAQHLVGEVVGVLEDAKPRHQARRQRRLAGAVRVDLPERLFQKAPIHRARQRHQRMLHVDDLIKPGAEQVLLAAVSPLPRPHPNLRSSSYRAENHGRRFDGIPHFICKESGLDITISGKSNRPRS